MTEKQTNTSVVRADLAEAVHQAIGGTRNRAVQILDSLIEGMVSELLHQRTLSISRFGVFDVKNKAARVGRNPKTGEPVSIPPRNTVVFRPSATLRNLLNS